VAEFGAMDFTITLSNDDWDPLKGGWRCPALQIPGTRVKTVYVGGTAADPKLYEVNYLLCLVRWGQDIRPKQVSAHIQAEKALSTEELTLKWRKLAIILPVIGSLAAAAITALLDSSHKTLEASPDQSKKDTVKVFERSNDFLATGDNLRFPSLLTQAKREAWFVGTTFYISTDQYHDLILRRLADGLDLNFLVLSPEGDAINRVAHLLGVPESELSADCLAGIRILNRTIQEARAANSPGTLHVKIIDEPLQTRLYFFDPNADEGHLYYIPQLNGTNSQTLPGFLAKNSATTYHTAYFRSVLKMWNDPGTKTLEDWKIAHPHFD